MARPIDGFRDSINTYGNDKPPVEESGGFGEWISDAWGTIMGRKRDAEMVQGAGLQDMVNSMTPSGAVTSDGQPVMVSSQGKWMRDEQVREAGKRVWVDTTNPMLSTMGAAVAPAAAVVTALDYGQRGINTGIATATLTAEANISGEYASVPYMRDGIGIGDIGRLVGDTWGSNVEIEDVNGQTIQVLNAITAGQGIATLIGRGGYNTIANVVPGMREAVDKQIEEDSFNELNLDWNQRKLYSWLTGLYSGFDVTDFKQRESAYNQGLGRWITGASDAAIQWYIGVDVIAMKAAGFAGRTLMTRTVDSFGDVNKMTDELVAHDAWSKGLSQGEILDVNGNVVRTVEAKRTDMGRLADSFVKMDQRQILKHKVATTSTDRLLVSRILGSADSFDKVSLGLRAMAGDMAAVDELFKADAIAGDALALKRQQLDDLKKVINFDPNNPVDTLQRDWSMERLGQLEPVYKQALEENRPLRDMVAALSKDGGISTVNFDKLMVSKLEYGPNSVARMQSQAEKAALRDERGLYVSETFRTGGAFGRVVRVMKSPVDYMKTARQIGKVDLNNDKNVVDELDAIFQTTPLFRRLAKMSPDALLPGMDETVSAFRSRIYNEMISAPTATARWEVWQKFDSQMTGILSRYYGIDPSRVAQVVKQYSTMKQGLLEQVQRHGYFEDSGDIYAMPQLKEALAGLDMQSKKAETFFATDFRFLETVFRLEQGSAARRKATSLNRGVDEMFSRFDAIWRPLVLMRLGYTQRNVAEGWLRELAAYGTLGVLKERGKGGTLNPDDAAFVRWASGFGRTADRVAGIGRGIKYGSVRKAIRNLDASRAASEESRRLAHEAQGKLTSVERLAARREKYLRELAQDRVASVNKRNLENQVGVVTEQIGDDFRGTATEVFENGQEVMLPSQYVSPLLNPLGKLNRRAKTMSGFESADDAIMRQVNDESIPVDSMDSVIGVTEDLGVSDIDSAYLKYLGPKEREEYLNIRDMEVRGEIMDEDIARHTELVTMAYRNAAAKALKEGHRPVRIVDSGLYQIIHSLDDITPTDVFESNLALVLKENLDKATSVRANVYGDVVDLRYKPLDAEKVATVVAQPDKVDEVLEMHKSIFGPMMRQDRVSEDLIAVDLRTSEQKATAANKAINEMSRLLDIADKDPEVLAAIGLRQMVSKLDDEARQWFEDNGLLITSSKLKSLMRATESQYKARRVMSEEVDARRQALKDSIEEYDWSDWDIPVFHGGTRVKGDELADDPINNVIDPAAVHKGIGFYSTENPNIGVDYIVNRALGKDGEPVFYVTEVDENINDFLFLDKPVNTYETEETLRSIFARMQEKYGDETDLETAWDEIDGRIRDQISDRQFSLAGDSEILDADVDQFREGMVYYFQQKFADDAGLESNARMEGRMVVYDRTEEWADTEYKAQMLWVEALRDEGFDGVTHIGGKNSVSGIEHPVYIWYNKPELTRVDELSDEAIAIRVLQQKMSTMTKKINDTQDRVDLRRNAGQYETKNFDAAGMTRNFERLLGRYMEAKGIGRMYVNDSLSPSGYRLIVNPDMVSVNTDQLDAVLPGQMITKDYADRTLEALQHEATVRHPQVWVPANIDDATLLDEFGGDTSVLNFLRTGKGSPAVKAKVARYMETRQGIGESNPYTHVQVGGNNGKFVTVSEMLGNKRTGAAYNRSLEGDEVESMFTYLVNNDSEMSKFQLEMGSLRQEVSKTQESFLADQEAAKEAADTLRNRIGRKANGRQYKKKLGSGLEEFEGKGYEKFETDGVFAANNQGAKNALDAGSDRRVQMELYGFTDRSQRMLQRTAEAKTYSPGDQSYWDTFADEVNKIWRNDPVGEMLFQGKSVEEIYANLKSTDRGRAWIRDVAGISDFRGYVSKDLLKEDAELAILTEIADRQSILSRLVPLDEADRARVFEHISKHDVTPMYLRTELGWRSDLQSLEGFGTQYELGKNWRGFTSRVMQTLGTVPENSLVRHPFYRARWREEMQRQAEIYAPQVSARQGGGPARFSEAQINAMNIVAKKRALQQVNDTLYTIHRVSTPAHLFRFIIPFFPAWASAMKFWLLRMPVEKPETLARYGLAFGAPESIGMFQDENGNPVKDSAQDGNMVPALFERIANKVTGADEGSLVIQLSPGVAKRVEGLTGGNSILGVSKGSLDFLLQGEHFWVPGLGPLVTLPLSWLASQKPDIATEIETGNFTGFSKFGPISELQKSLYGAALPFGPSKEKNILDLAAETVLPATAARWYQMGKAEDSAAFSNASTGIYQTDIIDWELSGREGPPPSFLDAVEKAKDFFRFRSLVSFTSPAAITFQSKYKFYIDEWRRIESAAYAEGGGGYEQAQAEFLNKYGTEFFAATLSLSGRSSGVSATVGEYKEVVKNPELIASLATYGDDASYVTMATRPFAASLNDGGFDPAVYAWQFNQAVEGAPGKYFRAGAGKRQDMLLDVDKEVGWFKFDNEVDRLDSLLTTNQINDEQYQILKSAKAREIGAVHGNWWKEYNGRGDARYIDSVRAMDDLLNNEQYMTEHKDEPYVQAMSAFRDTRNTFVAMLAERKRLGGSDNIEAKQNAGIAAAYAMAVERIGKTDPSGEFSRMHQRFFGSDKLLPIPGRDY